MTVSSSTPLNNNALDADQFVTDWLRDDKMQSVMDLLQPTMDSNKDKPAFSMGALSLTFRQLDKASRRFAAFLQKAGIEAGAHLAVQLPNILQYPVVMLGSLRAGVVLVNVNPMYTHHELAYQLTDAKVSALVILNGMDSAFKQLEDEVVSKLKCIIHCSISGDSASVNDNLALMQLDSLSQSQSSNIDVHVTFADIINHTHEDSFNSVTIKRDDLALLQYTGGTTGKPKGAMLTHHNISANVVQCYACFGDLVESKTIGQVKILNPLPLYHIFSFSVCALLGLYGGWEDILITNPRDMDGLVKTIGERKPNIIPSVNTLFNGMLNHPDFASLDFSQLQMSIGGGTAIIKAINDQWQSVTGKIISEGYGMSETGPVISMNLPTNTQFNGSVGMPLAQTQVKIIDETHSECAINERGEVCVQGPQIMQGYWAHDNADIFTEDGYFKTGDIGLIDDEGFVTLVDRKKDMILVSGFNVYPNEIEAVLTEHPKVNEVAVVGVADAHSAEVPKAFVVKSDDSLTIEELKAFAREHMTGYKCPQHYEFIAELPKSAVGKILRKELRQ